MAFAIYQSEDLCITTTFDASVLNRECCIEASLDITTETSI